MLRSLPVAFLVSLLAGCQWHPLGLLKTIVTPKRIESVGPVQNPGSITTQDSHTEIPLLPGSTITISTERNLERPKSDNINSSVVTSSHVEHTSTPTSWPPPVPPAPPSLAEITDAGNTGRFYWLALTCGIGAIPAFYFGHLKAGACLTLAACGIPLLIHLGHAIFASYFATGSVCLALAFVASWYFLRNHPDILAHLKSEEAKVSALIKSREPAPLS